MARICGPFFVILFPLTVWHGLYLHLGQAVVVRSVDNEKTDEKFSLFFHYSDALYFPSSLSSSMLRYDW